MGTALQPNLKFNKMQNYKKFVYFLMVLGSIYLIRTLSSCTKQDNDYKIAVRDIGQSIEPDSSQSTAFNIHNEYLDFLCSKIDARELAKVKSSQSIIQFSTLTKEFFETKYSNIPDSFIDQRINVYFTSYSGIEEKRAMFEDSAISTIVTNLENLSLSDLTVIEFNNESNNLIDSNFDGSFGLYFILGVAQGSYKYWKELPDNSCYLSNSISSSRQCRLCMFALADLAGAADGAAAGSLLGGVGAGPGAVMGGAIYSGLAALSW